MGLKDDELKRLEIEERRRKYEEAERRRAELLAQNEAIKAQKAAAQSAMQTKKAAEGATVNSATAADVNASALGYTRIREGDNDMARVVANYGKETPDIANMTYKQAMGFATRIVYDDERDDFLKRWQKAHKDIAPTMDEMRKYLNSQKPGGVYQAAGAEYSKQIQENFKNEYKSMQLLHSFDGLTDMTGDDVNMNTASLPDIIRSIRATASPKKREAMASALETLTKTPGNRFYGVTFDKSDAEAFLDSPALSKSDYDDEVDYYRGQFDPVAGSGEKNTAAYYELLSEIENSDNTPYVKNQYRDALNDAYIELISDKLPEIRSEAKPVETVEDVQTPEAGSEENEPMPKGGAVWNAQGEAYTIVDGKAVRIGEKAAPAPIKPSVPTLQDALGDERFMKRYIEKIMEESGEDAANWTEDMLKSVFKKGVESKDYERFVDEMMASSVRVASAGDLTGVLSAANKSKSKLPAIDESEEAPKEVFGPDRPTIIEEKSHSFWQALRDEAFYGVYKSAVEAKKEIPYGSIDLTHDPVKAVAYASNGEASKLTRETQDALAKLIESSPGLKAIFKMEIDQTQDELLAAQGGDVYARAFVDATRNYWATGDASGILGSTLGYYLNLSDSDRYDPDLQRIMKGALAEIVVDAEDAYERGDFDYDPAKETLYDAYLRVNPEATAQVRGVIRTVDEIRKEAKRQAMLATESQERNKQEQLRLDQEQLRTGNYTPEAYTNVLSSTPEVTTRTARADKTYNKTIQDITTERTLADLDDFSWYNEMTTRYLGADVDLYSVEAMQYKDMLAQTVKDVVLGDVRVAAFLGYEGGVGEMYESWGGMDLEKLYLRAEESISRMADNVTEEDVEVLEQAQSVYTGTGENVSGLDAFGAGTAHGALDTSSEMLEGVWALGAMSKEDMPAAVYKVRKDWISRYNPAIAATMYKKAMYEYCDLVPQEYGNSIREYLDAGYDPFRLGIEPTQESVVLSTSKALGARAEAIQRWAFKELDKSKGTMFESGSALGSTTVMAAVDMFTQGTTHSAFLGSMLGYGIVGAGQQMKEELAFGRDRKGALTMGAMRAFSDATANMLTNGAFYDRALGFIGYTPTVAMGVEAAGDIASARATMGMVSRFKNSAFLAGAKGAVQTLGEEMFVDEFAEDALWQLIGGGTESLIDGATVFKAAADALLGFDAVESASKTLKNLGTNFVATLPMAVFGALGSAARKSVENRAMKNTVQAAAEVLATGTPEAAERFVSALASDLNDPDNRDALNQALHDAAVGQEAVVIAMTDEEAGKDIDVAAKAQEQADAHAVSEANSIAAAEAGRESALAAQERMNNGEINPELVTQVANGVLANAKNSQSVLEHRREKNQKQAEADAAFAEGMKKATTKAEAEVGAREAAAAQSAGTQNRIAQIEARLREIEDGYAAMLEADPDADMPPEMMRESVDLEAEREELLSQPAQESAPQIDEQAVSKQRGEVEAKLTQMDKEANAYMEAQAEREKAQQEADEMKPVYQSLRNTQVYVDETQKANILSRTGLKSLPQVNRKFGLKLTSDKSRGATSLDGSFFAELADLAPGRIPQDVTVAEDALMDIVERKKQLKGMQASVGETAYEQYLPDGTFYNIQDPVMQQLTSDVKKVTGVDIVVAPLAGNVRALYDRAEKRIIINSRIGAGEISKKVVMHELTHYIEGSEGYGKYKEAVLKAAYAHDADGELRRADEERILSTYAEAGVTLDEAGIESELVAEATEKIIDDPDGYLTRQLLGQKQKGLLYNLAMKLRRFLARKKAQRAGNLDQYEMIQTAYERLKEAIMQGGGDNQNADPTVDLDAAARRRGDVAHAGEDGQMQFSLIGRSADGKGIYESNFPKGTPKEEKQKHLIKIWQNVWSQKPIELYVKEDDGSERKITAEFDPDYDPSNIRKTDLGKVISNKNGSSGDRTVTLNLADDLYDLARTSEYYTSEDESGKDTDTHKGVKRWHYFFNDIVYRGENGDIPYTVWLDVKEKDSGGYVYQLYARKTKKDASATAGDSYQAPLAGISQSAGQADAVQSLGTSAADTSISDTSVSENTPGVNPYSTQNRPQYSLAPNQFGNKTAQELSNIDEAVKDILIGSKHEIVGNEERLDAAWQAVNERGADIVADELLSLPAKSWGAQENVNAALCAVLANRDGDIVTAATILTRYDKEGTVQGQALQARQLIKRLSPEGAMLEMIRKADRKNAQKGIPKGSFPTGEEAPRRGGEKKREDGSIERVHAAAQEIYHEADELKAELDKLPTDVSYDNPWNLPLSDKQMALIREFGLMGEKLPGIRYNVATKKQRMLAAILAMDPAVEGDGLKTLCQQLTAIKKGYAVVTTADLRYTASQMAEFRAKEGASATIPKTPEGTRALARAYQAQDNVATADSFKKWTALRFANMLSAPATMVRNIAGNVISGGMENAATVIASAVDKSVAKKTGTRTTDVTTKEERKAGNAAFAQEVVHTVSDYMIDHVDTGHGRRYDVGGQGRVFQTEFFENYRNMVDFAMQIGDRPFFEQKYAEEKAIVERLGMKKTEMTDEGTIIQRDMTAEEIHQEATMRALHRVFQEDNAIVDWMNKLRGMNPYADLAVTTLLPFIKTPTNVAMRAIEYSPIGLVSALVRKAAWGLDGGRFGSISQRDYVMGIGRGLTGTGLCVAGWALAAAGMIGFGREDEENDGLREVKKAQGIPYGMYLNIGGQMREIDWAMPVASAIAVGADFFRALDDGEGMAEAALNAVLSSVGGQIMDTPMMSAMNDIFRGYDSTEDAIFRIAKTGAASLLNQTFSPSIIRAIAKATDPYVRDTGADNGIMSQINQSVIQYWPGLRQLLPKATDMTGDYMLQGGYYSWGKENQNAALHFLDSFFTPTATLGEKNDDALYALLDLAYTEGETDFLPRTIVGNNGKLTINKSLMQATGMGDAAYNMVLTADERREFNRLYGDILFNGLRGARYEMPNGFEKRHKGVDLNKGIRRMLESGEWERMSGEEKRSAISKMKSAAKELCCYLAVMNEL